MPKTQVMDMSFYSVYKRQYALFMYKSVGNIHINSYKSVKTALNGYK